MIDPSKFVKMFLHILSPRALDPDGVTLALHETNLKPIQHNIEFFSYRFFPRTFPYHTKYVKQEAPTFFIHYNSGKIKTATYKFGL